MVGVDAAGTSAAGSTAYHLDQELVVDVAGGIRTGTIMDNGLRIVDRLAGRSTCEISTRDPTGNLHYSPGEQAYVTWHGRRLFGGSIEEIEEEAPGESEDIFNRLRCVDFNQLLDRFFVSATYEEKTVLQIVTDIVNVQTRLKDEGVTVGEVQVGPTIKKANFNYVKVSDVFKDLAELTGMAWNVDHYKAVRFFERATYTAPFNFTATPGERKYRNLSYSKSRSQYRNRQWLRAGVDETAQRTENFRGDSTSIEPSKRNRTFTLTFPVSRIVSIKRDGITQRIGIKGKDKDGDATVPSSTTWPQWLHQKGDADISQNSLSDETLNPTLTSPQILEVVYFGQFPIVIDAQLDSEITARALVESGTGIYESVVDDKDLDGGGFAAEKAARLLTLYGRIPAEVSLETDVFGLAPGQLQTNTFNQHDLTAVQFLIDSVNVSFPRFDLPRVVVKMLDGERQEGWADFFRKLFAAGREFVIRENETIILVRSETDTVTFTDTRTRSVTPPDTDLLKPYTDDPYSWAVFGEYSVPFSSEKLALAAFGRSRWGAPHGS